MALTLIGDPSETRIVIKQSEVEAERDKYAMSVELRAAAWGFGPQTEQILPDNSFGGLISEGE